MLTTVLSSHDIFSCSNAFAVNHTYVFATAAVSVSVVHVRCCSSAVTSVYRSSAIFCW